MAVLDADKEGFLRSERSLVQTCGRAARNVNGMVILYGDTITRSMQRTIDETARRRAIQKQYNRDHDITPRTIHSEIKDGIQAHLEATGYPVEPAQPLMQAAEAAQVYTSLEELRAEISRLEKKMQAAAEKLAFEEAAGYRDRMQALKMLELEVG